MRGRPSDHALAQALALAAQGTPAFPCRDDKRPACPHGFKDATADPAGLRRLWSRWPGELVGVPTGEPSGWAVLDIDVRHGGDAWLDRHLGRLPRTYAYGTRSGGCHLRFRHRAGLRSSAGRIAPGVDVRAEGGYVIWWPAHGCEVLCDAPPAAWPDWLVQAPAPRRVAAPARGGTLDEHALHGLLRFIAGSAEGERNVRLHWASCRLGEYVAAGALDEEYAVALAVRAALRAGYPAAAAERTALSGIRRGSEGGAP